MSNGFACDARRAACANRSFGHDGSYIVTGGLGGIGMVVARWLVDRGAGRIVLNGRSHPSDEQRQSLAEPGKPRRNRRRARRRLCTRGRGATRDSGRSDRTAIAGSPPRGGGDRRQPRRHPDQGKPGAGLGAQGGRRITAARSHHRATARLVGRLLFGGLAAGLPGAGRLRLRECVARRPGRVATSIGSARNRDQLGPVVGGGSRPLADA